MLNKILLNAYDSIVTSQRRLAKAVSAAESATTQSAGSQTGPSQLLSERQAARYAVRANGAVVRSADEMLGTLIDMLA